MAPGAEISNDGSKSSKAMPPDDMARAATAMAGLPLTPKDMEDPKVRRTTLLVAGGELSLLSIVGITWEFGAAVGGAALGAMAKAGEALAPYASRLLPRIAIGGEDSASGVGSQILEGPQFRPGAGVYDGERPDIMRYREFSRSQMPGSPFGDGPRRLIFPDLSPEAIVRILSLGSERASLPAKALTRAALEGDETAYDLLQALDEHGIYGERFANLFQAYDRDFAAMLDDLERLEVGDAADRVRLSERISAAMRTGKFPQD